MVLASSILALPVYLDTEFEIASYYSHCLKVSVRLPARTRYFSLIQLPDRLWVSSSLLFSGYVRVLAM
jgi:hypothetical protein